MYSRFLLTIIASAAITGCGAINTQLQRFQPDPIMVTNPKIDEPPIDLLALLKKDPSKIELPAKNDALFNQKYNSELQIAIKNFNKEWGSDAELQRDLILDQVILFSNEKCEDYKSRIFKKQAEFNFWLGTLGVVLGGAGGVVQGAQAANNLSALSAVTSGIRTEYNQDFYGDQAANVLTKAIDKRRQDMLNDFLVAKKKKIEDYSVILAIADGVKYHGVCSLIGGIQYADHAITTLETSKGMKTTAAALLNKDVDKGTANSVNPTK